ncbi:uncharacterized protein LOC104889792 [Beta vulgaris subsp. vulgaris]|uniref:uncharacterized protein LOC104889792 n=1 Tax=Beta vulgaris subsp. vulgaris TaxID=3555 RepID=UPI002036C41D|nr:uncharacterized protein LOC104889792 [Beta vulgaris subsp. vulgaris]
MESEPIHLDTIRSRIAELSEFLIHSPSSDSDQLLQHCVLALETNVNQIVADHSDVGSFKDQDLDAYMDRLRDDLRTTEAETASLAEEIQSLRKLHVQGTCQLESNLESLRYVVEYAQLRDNLLTQPVEGSGEEISGEHVGKFKQVEGQPQVKAHHDDYFEVLKLKHQIEMNEMTLKSLQDHLNLKRIEAIENIEEALTGLKVIDFEGNTIRVSLRTYLPDVEGVICQLNADDNMKQSEVNHELLIEVVDGTMELKNVEISPNDVYIGDVVEATNTFSKLFSVSPVPQTRSSLGWFLQKVQDKIVVCTLRQQMVKIANNSRHSFEYLDKDELIVAHMIGGIDAFVKPCQGWPLSTSPLKLVSFRSSDQNVKEISLSLLSKVEELANSFDLNIRKSLTSFVDRIEETLLDKFRPDLHL